MWHLSLVTLWLQWPVHKLTGKRHWEEREPGVWSSLSSPAILGKSLKPSGDAVMAPKMKEGVVGFSQVFGAVP